MSGLRFTPPARRDHLDASAGVLAALRIIGADADRRVPVGEGFAREGSLRDSQTIEVDGNRGRIAYTDRAAIPAHEALDIAPDGGERKYLEAALDVNRAAVLEAIADSLRPQPRRSLVAWSPDTWESEFVRSVAETLADEGVARWVASGAYPLNAPLPAVYVATMPAAGPAVPVRAISLTPYLIGDTPDEHTEQGLQVRCRGGQDPVDALNMASAVWRVLHRPLGLTLGTSSPQWCPSSSRRSAVAGVALDPTGKAREAVSNYALLLPRASVEPWS